MPISFTIGDLVLDQTAGVQTGTDGDDVNLTKNGSNIDGFGANANVVDPGFETFLASLVTSGALTSDDVNFAVNVDGAASTDNTFITVNANAGETITDLFFKELDNPLTHDNQLDGIQTLGGDPLYLHIDSSGNYATVTTASGTGGSIVAAFALVGEAFSNTVGSLNHSGTAGLQMVTFAPIMHTDTADPDDRVDFSDVLQIGASASLSFNFDQLKSGDFLWAAVGDGSAAMLITGQDLNVNDKAGTHLGDMVKSGSTDPSDSVNTSQAAPGSEATVGINAQHFAPTNSGAGPTGVLTFVTGFQPLVGATPNYADINVNQIDYNDYINVSAAAINISQLTGGSTSRIHISLWEAGGAGSDQAPADLIPEEGYSNVGGVSQSYIGNQDTDSHLTDDTRVNVGSVTVAGHTWTTANSGTTFNGITVTISLNDITVIGANAGDTIGFTAADTSSTVDGTFNRIDIQALAGSAAFDIGHIDLTQGGMAGDNLGSHLYVDDDGPVIGNSDGVAANAIKEGLVDFVAGSSVSYSLNGHVGTDPNASPYTLASWTTDVTVNGVHMHAVANASSDPTSVTYYADTSGNGIFGDSTDVGYFRLSLSQTDPNDSDATTGAYKFEVLNGPPAAVDKFPFTDLPSGQNLFGIIAADKTNLDGHALLVFSEKADVKSGDGTMTTTSGTINTSKGGGPITIGDSNQMYDNTGEGAVFVNITNPRHASVAGAGLTQKSADDADNVKFGGTYEASTGQVQLVQIQGNQPASLQITAYDIDETLFAAAGGAGVDTNGESRDFVENPQNSAHLVNVTGVRVTIGGQLVESWAYNSTTHTYELQDVNGDHVVDAADNNAAVDVQFDDTGHAGFHTATVSGLSISGNTPTLIEYDTETSFEMTSIDYVGGAYDIGGFQTIQNLDTPDQFFEFTAQATDGDGDTAQACWEVGVDGTGANDGDNTLNTTVANIEPGQPSDCPLVTTLTASSALSASAMASSPSKWSGVPITSHQIDLNPGNPLSDMIHHYHADYMLI